MWDAINKYGWGNIEHKIVADGVSSDVAYLIEAELIAKYQANNPLFGYNKSIGGKCGSLGCKRSEEYKKKVSEGLKRAYKHGNKTAGQKAILQYAKNGELINSYSSKREASKATGIDERNIGRCCYGRCKSAGGYIWKYA